METTNAAKARHSGASYALYLGLIGLLVAIVVAGYLSFRQFATTVMPQMEAFNLLALAVAAGIASFFSPCAFPLLPSYLAFYAAARSDGPQSAQPAQALKLGLAAAAGVITFTLILGTAIGILGASAGKTLSISGPEPNAFVRWFRGGVGVILISLGVAQWLNLNLKPGLADALAWRTRPRHETERSIITFYLYGLGYNAAGMGCTGPILAGLTIFALSTGGFNAALTAFVVFAMTMGGLMLLISGLVATSQKTLILRLKASTPRIKQITSILLVSAGLFNILTTTNTDIFVRLLFP